MGNSLSFQNTNLNNENGENNAIKTINKDNLTDLVDEIAADFILKQNLIDMLRFSDKNYYDNMIILTSSIINKELTDLELGILQDRVLNTANHNMNTQNNEETKNNGNTIYFTSSDELKQISLRNEKEKQKALLIISKFYIKIMTIFSAITATIDPQYVYETENGERRYFQLKDYDSYKMLDKKSENIRIHQLFNPMGLVKKRLTILKNKINDSMVNGSNEVIMNPGELFCKMNTKDGDSINENTLKNEIGLKELDLLYYDIYDESSKSWTKKSSKMKKKYEKDLKKFYQIFTGKKVKPTNIKSFEDIETLQFHKLQRCRNQDFFKDIVVSKNDKLFLKYMRKIKEIEEITASYKKKLMHILKTIFVVENKTNGEVIVINPDMTLEHVLLLQEQTKDSILNIYTGCEKHFIEALLIYEELYDEKFGVLQLERLNYLNNRSLKEKNNVNKTIVPIGLNRSVLQEEGINQQNKLENLNTQNKPLTSKLLNNKSNVNINKPAYVTPQININSQSPVQYEFPNLLEETISPIKSEPSNQSVTQAQQPVLSKTIAPNQITSMNMPVTQQPQPEQQPQNLQEQPVQPEQQPQEQPVQPVQPVQPEQQKQEQPVQPVQPVQPEQQQQEQPVQPVQPVQPEQQPVQPEQQQQEQPVQPVQPEQQQQEQPVQQEEQPVQPEQQPVQPEQQPQNLQQVSTNITNSISPISENNEKKESEKGLFGSIINSVTSTFSGKSDENSSQAEKNIAGPITIEQRKNDKLENIGQSTTLENTKPVESEVPDLFNNISYPKVIENQIQQSKSKTITEPQPNAQSESLEEPQQNSVSESLEEPQQNSVSESLEEPQQNSVSESLEESQQNSPDINTNKININSPSVPIIKNNSEPFQKNNIVINEPVKEQEGGNMDDLKQQIMKILS